jgi:hypothetical protein
MRAVHGDADSGGVYASIPSECCLDASANFGR